MNNHAESESRTGNRQSYIVEREYLGKYSTAELIRRIIKANVQRQ